MPKSMYDIIKKQNGQNFANTVRKNDSGIFDIKDLDIILKYAGRDAEPLLPYLNSLKNIKIRESKSNGSPFELLERAGYHAELADTHEKHNKISKYYAPGERVCFLDKDCRTDDYYVINAVRKDVDKIKRTDFKNPERQDEYGTSVISIHIKKSGGVIIITNRYNHTVGNPDNTFGSNPDNIIPGLSDALRRYFKVNFSSSNIDIPDEYHVINNQIIKYNQELDGVYFGNDFYAKGDVITELNKDSQIMLDYLIYDFGNAKDNKEKARVIDVAKTNDGLIGMLSQKQKNKKTGELKERKVKITKNDNDEKIVQFDDDIIFTVKDGRLIKADFLNAKKINKNTLYKASSLTNFSAPNAKILGEEVLYNADSLTSFSAPNVEILEDGVLHYADSLIDFSVEKAKEIGNYVLCIANSLTSFSAPNAEILGEGVLYNADSLINFSAEKAKKIGKNALRSAKSLTNFSAPNAEILEGDVLRYANSLTNFSAPNAEILGNRVLYDAVSLTNFSAEKVKKFGNNVLHNAKSLTNFSAPNAEILEDDVLCNVKTLKNFDAPKIPEKVRNEIFKNNKQLAFTRGIRSIGKKKINTNVLKKVFKNMRSKII